MDKLARVQLAKIIEPPIQSSDLDVPLPPALQNVRGYTEVTSSLEATAGFAEIGDYVLGKFDGLKEMSLPDKNKAEGRRQQWIYYLNIPVDSNGEPVAGEKVAGWRRVGVWGSAILDRMMTEAVRRGLKESQSLMIQYVGDIDTDQPSPAKNFRVIYK